jgi:hypothetical protein
MEEVADTGCYLNLATRRQERPGTLQLLKDS